jgi:hypothetical protein
LSTEAGGYFWTSSGGLTTPWPIGFKDDVEISAAHYVEPEARRHHALRHVQPDLAPLVDEPNGDVFEGLVDIAVQQFETEPLRSGIFQ